MTAQPMLTSPARDAATAAVDAGRWELLRSLGAIASTPPPLSHPIAATLGLPPPAAVEHTGVFVLSTPPHAAIYLRAEGKLGGEGLDRVAGFWRALALTPPPDADHLGALLALYAELGDAEAATRGDRARTQLRHARETLLWEHLWSWAPGYLTAVERLGTPALSPWARLTLQALAREARRAAPTAALPLALREAPSDLATARSGGGCGGVDRGYLLDSLLVPVRSGVIITREDLTNAAASAGVGCRAGERRYTLRAMLDQDSPATVDWLRTFAQSWAQRHARHQLTAAPDSWRWWADRASRTAMALSELLGRLAAAGHSWA